MILRGDPARLRQILLNLVNNSLKFTHQGEVMVRISKISEADQSVRLRFEVQDTGIGIEAHKLGQIFSPFTQADGSITRKYGGTGLGLSISNQLVELMQGEMGVESTYGQGSCFWFEVPLQRGAILSPAGIDAEVIPAGSHILVISPKPALSIRLHQALDGLDCRITRAANTAQALMLLEPGHSLVLVDWPVTQACPDVRSLRRLRPHLPLILLAYPGQENTLGMRDRARFDSWIAKPLQLQELRSSLTRFLQQRTAAEPISQFRVCPAAGLAPHLLLAEDNPINQAVAEAILSKLGYTLDIVPTGSAALKALARTDYALVLMDCQMPEMDGYEATRQIRQGKQGVLQQAIPIIALTAHAMSGDREVCLAAGMDDYLAKPFTPQEIEAVIQRWLPQVMVA